MGTQSTEGCFELFQEVLPNEFLEHLEPEERRRGIFPVSLVAWLFIYQRLNYGASLGDTVERVIWGEGRALNSDSKRVQQGAISQSSGGYCRARQKLSLNAAEEITDQVFDYFTSHASSEWGRPVYALDGTTIKLAADKRVRKEYPPARNQNGKSKNGLLHVLVAHDLVSGYAARPFYGAYHGEKAESEAALTRRAIEHLPDEAIYVGDAGFGIFSVCHALHTNGSEMVMRLQLNRAQKILQRNPEPGTDERVCWVVSRRDRESNPEIPAGTEIQGRFICERVQSREGTQVLLCLFTTLMNLSAAEIIKIYGLRWNIETDLRTLKKTVRLEYIAAKDPLMIGKELLMGIAAYNLVRGLMASTAQVNGKMPRDYSFTTMLRIVHQAMPRLFAAETEERRIWVLKTMKHLARGALVRKRPTRHATKRGKIS